MIGNQKSQGPLTERSAFLRSLPLFAGLTGEALRFLAEEAQAREYEAGAIIFHAGEPGYTCHIITKGYEEAVYTVDGVYTFADSGETRYARLYFANGVLQQVFGFTAEDGNGAPREILPQTGDTFTVLDKWLDLNAQGQVTQTSRQAGETLTFGTQMFTWTELDAPAGEYLVGFIVEDLDGNAHQMYEQVTVQ